MCETGQCQQQACFPVFSIWVGRKWWNVKSISRQCFKTKVSVWKLETEHVHPQSFCIPTQTIHFLGYYAGFESRKFSLADGRRTEKNRKEGRRRNQRDSKCEDSTLTADFEDAGSHMRRDIESFMELRTVLSWQPARKQGLLRENYKDLNSAKLWMGLAMDSFLLPPDKHPTQPTPWFWPCDILHIRPRQDHLNFGPTEWRANIMGLVFSCCVCGICSMRKRVHQALDAFF